MSRLLGQGWSTLAFSVVCWATMFGVSPAIAGHDHKKTTKYELVQGYILQPQANSTPAPAAQPAASASLMAASAQSPDVSVSPPPQQPQLQLAAPPQPQVSLQLQQAPVQTMTFQMVQAPIQTVQLQFQPAPIQAVQLVQLHTVQLSTVSIAPQLQTSAPSQMVATPVQLLLPQRRCHFFGH